MVFSLKQKLIFLSLSIALFVPVLGGVSYYLSNQVYDQYDKIATITVPNLEHIGKMDSSFKNVIRGLWRLTAVTDEEFKSRIHKNIAENLKVFNEHLKQYADVPFVAGEQELYEPIVEHWNVFQKDVPRIKSLSPEQISVALLEPVFQKNLASLEGNLNRIMDFQKEVSHQRSVSAVEIRERAVSMLVTITLASLVIAALIGYFFARKLAQNLQHISETLSEAGEQVSSAAKQIKIASDGLSQANSEQAASLEETAASIEEINSMIKKNTENAKESSRMSFSSREKAETGRKVVNKMITAIQEIDESNSMIMKQISEGNKRIEEIVKVISDIGDKTKVINDIVFQTKLLSFNASVEAARAGEDGKGFAVVAEEVGNLAQMSGNASKEISEMLDSSLHRVRTIVQETNESVHVLVEQGKIKVSTGTAIAKECGTVLEEIVTSIAHVAQMSQDISTASMEQSQGVQEITKAVHQLDEVTQNNAATSEESATAADHLASQASSLKAVVEELVMTVEGKKSPVKTESQEPARHHNVVKLERKPVPKKVQTAAPLKKAAGAEPSHDDPRFEEV
jgi:methyl-accepting chemotaxis protein